jgi:creatinine amidohydrolase
MTERVRYVELTPTDFRARLAEAPIAYLPLGTLEWHGEHLPLGSDGLQSQGFFIRLAHEVGGIVLPMLFLGPDRAKDVNGKTLYGMDYADPENEAQLDGSAYWVDMDTFGAILKAALAQLKRAGFKIVVAHGHGPSTGYFCDHIAEWEEAFGLRLFICWNDETPREYGIMTDHAGPNETSLVMAMYPDLVQMEHLPEDPDAWPVGVGGKDDPNHDPRLLASPERGKKAIQMQIAYMKKVLADALAALE